MHMNRVVLDWGSVNLLLLRCKHSKSRDTLLKLLQSVYCMRPEQTLTEPPKIRSVTTALFWFRRGFAGNCHQYGEQPEWILKQTSVNHELSAAAPQFELTKMIQYCLDNDLKDEAEIALQYAQIAYEDTNAMAFLNSNQQPKYVKDCCAMLRYYRRAMLNNLFLALPARSGVKVRLSSLGLRLSMESGLDKCFRFSCINCSSDS
uniref:DNA 3'-5' helicase n=1 Tax=Tadarida brasiliensis papillomavirus TaxID=2507922 RepID=A0A411EZX4_9PAPI|nr:putative early protein E1 [Tadarida brasiliensis papillomavirus]